MVSDGRFVRWHSSTGGGRWFESRHRLLSGVDWIGRKAPSVTKEVVGPAGHRQQRRCGVSRPGRAVAEWGGIVVYIGPLGPMCIN